MAQIIACHNDGNPLNGVVISPLLIYADSIGIVTDVHQGPYHHLVIDCHLYVTYVNVEKHHISSYIAGTLTETVHAVRAISNGK